VAAVIKQVYGIQPELIGGRGGIFRVCVDGDCVYTNGLMGGVPETAVVMDALRDKIGE
jgi:predicted Rdx family selenoprotein